MSSIFVVATDTDAGKTWVTAKLLQQFQALGKSVAALKPIASGVGESGLNNDVAQLLALQPGQTSRNINFKTYHRPVAPALAARNEGGLCPRSLHEWLVLRSAGNDITLIESLGGLMTPLIASEQQVWLVSDWLGSIKGAQIILVVPLRLGCMNQALLACSEMKHSGISPTWIILNDIDGLGDDHETQSILTPCLARLLGWVPHLVYVQQNAAEIVLP